MLDKFLQEIGLSDKEARVYLALLEVDNDSVLDLSKKTKINRTTIYPVLESLAKKGLISEIKIDKKVRFAAEPPERIETYIERRKIGLEEQGKRLKDILPQMKSVQRESGEKPVIKYYEGKEGIMSAITEYFGEDKGGESFFIYSKDLVYKIFTEEERKQAKGKRLKSKIHANAIYTSKLGDIADQEKEMSTRIRVDGEKYPISCDIGIYKDYVRIHTLGSKLSAVYIKSEDIAETLRSLFKITFDNLKKLNK